MKRPDILTINLVIDCADAAALAAFYSALLSYPITHPYTEGWAAITSPAGNVIAFQEVEGYTPPTWPWAPGKQGQMMHLDVWVENLEEGVAFALSLGATEAETQYYDDSRTLFDPAGHPFCIDTAGENA